MGCCLSSTEYVVDPITGEEKKKKTLGGAYPGQRRPQHAPYAPPVSLFGADDKATVHFKAYGGGNALTLVQQDGTAVPESGKPQPQFIQVTLPSGVEAGQTIHVQAPDGRMNAIVIPPGFGPGSTFTVEFAPDEVPPPAKAEIPSSGDGFAAGFNNPNWRPDATATAVPANEPEVVVQATEQDADGSYPTTTYQPLYTTTPAYPSK